MKQVLVVDDSRSARALIAHTLSTEMPDWTIHQAGDGVEAMQQLAAAPIDIVCVDYTMPDTDGLTLAQRMRDAGFTGRIILHTANIQDSVKQRADEASITLVRKTATRASILELAKEMSLG